MDNPVGERPVPLCPGNMLSVLIRVIRGLSALIGTDLSPKGLPPDIFWGRFGGWYEPSVDGARDFRG